MNTETMILTKDEANFIRQKRKDEEEYQKMIRSPPTIYTHKNDGKIKIRI